MVPLPYFGSHEDAIGRAQHEAAQMRRCGVLASLPNEVYPDEDDPGHEVTTKA